MGLDEVAIPRLKEVVIFLQSYLLENVSCKFCDSGFIEDEFHFIMVCKLYTCYRVTLFSSLSDIVNLNMFDENHIFKYIMSV